jgi:hypothetical protein
VLKVVPNTRPSCGNYNPINSDPPIGGPLTAFNSISFQPEENNKKKIKKLINRLSLSPGASYFTGLWH